MSNVEPKSPLTIIAILAGIIEASALASLPFLGEDSQGIYTWFLVGFPPLLTILFFLTLNFNSKSLHSFDNNEVPGELQEETTLPVYTRQLDLPPAPPAQRAALNNQAHASNEPHTSTISVSGAHANVLIDHLVRHVILQNAELGSLVFRNLDTGTQTTLTTSAINADSRTN